MTGLSNVREALGYLLQRSIDSNEHCPVCWEICNDLVITSCAHVFCYSCLYLHLEEQAHCPLCRADLKRFYSYDKTWSSLRLLESKARISRIELELERARRTQQRAAMLRYLRAEVQRAHADRPRPSRIRSMHVALQHMTCIRY